MTTTWWIVAGSVWAASIVAMVVLCMTATSRCQCKCDCSQCPNDITGDDMMCDSCRHLRELETPHCHSMRFQLIGKREGMTIYRRLPASLWPLHGAGNRHHNRNRHRHRCHRQTATPNASALCRNRARASTNRRKKTAYARCAMTYTNRISRPDGMSAKYRRRPGRGEETYGTLAIRPVRPGVGRSGIRRLASQCRTMAVAVDMAGSRRPVVKG